MSLNSPISIPTVAPSSPSYDDTLSKDFKFVLVEKENTPVKKESERLVMTKDTGKQFMSAAPTTYGTTTYISSTSTLNFYD